jgi:hypothetical protein
MKRWIKIVGLLAAVLAISFFLVRPKYDKPVSKNAQVPYKADPEVQEQLASLGYIDSGDYEEPKSTVPGEVARKIIQSGHVSLYVKHYDPFYQALQKQLAQEGGFISNLEANRSSGKLLSARIVVRVPSTRTNIFVSWLHEKGEIISEKITAEDVSEEFYDTQARLANAKRLESRLIDMVKTHTGKLQDLILLEEKIGEIRGQIEQMEARIRTLNRLVSLATLTIDVQVTNTTVNQAPTFASRIGKTWRKSTEALTDFLKDTTLVFIGVLPWIPVFILMIGMMLLIFRVGARMWRKRTA